MECEFIKKAGSCIYSDERDSTWFYKGIVKGQQLFPLCGQDIPSIMIPVDFFVPFKVNIPEEEIIAGLEDCAFDEAVQRAYSQERNALRSEKERPWGLRTYRPFRGQLQDAKPSFKEMLRIAEAVIDEIGMQMSSKSRGRRRNYDWKRILAALLCKGVRSFSDLERELRDAGYCEVDGRTPCDSELHYVYSQIPEEWLDKALKQLDDKVTALYAKFDAFLNEFVIDGTGIACDTLVEREVVMEKRLVKETEEITILTRIITNTVRAVTSHTNKISVLSDSLEQGSIIYGDPEFDVKANYSDAEERKLGEMPFGNAEKRSPKCYYRKDKEKGMKLYFCAHNILAYFSNEKWRDLFLRISK
ncbi:MAG: hypothetical protein H8D26_04150 [Methanomicrobia archaeon]|nr:hypothetical protein [Methanomicrobia archaeon]